MEIISQILKLKKQLVEKSLADLVNKLAAIEFEIKAFEMERDKKRPITSPNSKANRELSGIDFQIDHKWHEQLMDRICRLEYSRAQLGTEVEIVKSELRSLTGKLDMREKQIKITRIAKGRERMAFEDERRSDNWRLGKKSQD